MKIYAIKNCNTVKKARNFLEEKGIAYSFHDYKKDGVDEEVLRRAVDTFGWNVVLNSKGMTWRKMDESERAKIVDAHSAMALMKEKTSIIKRPLLVHDGGMLIGFQEEEWKSLLG